MMRQKNLLQAWRPEIYALILLLLSGCFPSRLVMTTAQYQIAADLVDKGTLLLRAGKLDQAEGAFGAAADMGPMAAAIDGLGCVAFKRQDYNSAEKYFVKAYELDNRYNNSLGNLAVLYKVNGLSMKAQQLFQMALASEPGNFRVRNNYAVHLLDNQYIDDAKLELLKALALAKHPIVTNNLIKLGEYE